MLYSGMHKSQLGVFMIALNACVDLNIGGVSIFIFFASEDFIRWYSWMRYCVLDRLCMESDPFKSFFMSQWVSFLPSFGKFNPVFVPIDKQTQKSFLSFLLHSHLSIRSCCMALSLFYIIIIYTPQRYVVLFERSSFPLSFQWDITFMHYCLMRIFKQSSSSTAIEGNPGKKWKQQLQRL